MMKWLGHVGAAGVVASIAIGAVGPGTTAARDSAPPGGPAAPDGARSTAVTSRSVGGRCSMIQRRPDRSQPSPQSVAIGITTTR